MNGKEVAVVVIAIVVVGRGEKLLFCVLERIVRAQ